MEPLARACVKPLIGIPSTGNKPRATCVVCRDESYRRNNRARASVVVPRPPKRAFERLEPTAMKVARWVLRGGGDSNAVLLPDSEMALERIANRSKSKQAPLAHSPVQYGERVRQDKTGQICKSPQRQLGDS